MTGCEDRLEKAVATFAPKDKDLAKHITKILALFEFTIASRALASAEKESDTCEVNLPELSHILYALRDGNPDFPYYPGSWPTHSRFLNDCMAALTKSSPIEIYRILEEEMPKANIDDLLPSIEQYNTFNHMPKDRAKCASLTHLLFANAENLPAYHFDVSSLLEQFKKYPEKIVNKPVVLVGYFIGKLNKEPKLTDYLSEQPPCVDIIIRESATFTKKNYALQDNEFMLTGFVDESAKIKVLSLAISRDLPEEFIKIIEKYRC
jgi:hypothetical protein